MNCNAIDERDPARAGAPGAGAGDGGRHFEDFEEKYGRIEKWGNGVMILGFMAGAVFGIYFALSPKAAPIKGIFALGVTFGWGVLAPVLLIYLLALKKGRAYWHGFWIYQEAKYKISSRLMRRIYAGLIILGFVSTLVVLL